MNKLSIEIKLFIMLFKLAQLVQFDLALISGKLHCLLFFAIGIVVCEEALKMDW